MKVKFGIFLLLALASCVSSKKVPYFQSEENRKGQIVDLPSYRVENAIRFRPDDVLGITVNVPGESAIASDYNLPFIPSATSENSTEENISQGIGRQAFMVNKNGTIDYPVLGVIHVAGYTQQELENHLKDLVMERLKVQPVITVRLLNFKITVTGEVARPNTYSVEKDNINILEALALANDMTIFGKRDDLILIRQKPDGGYERISLDISREDIISSPYFFLRQNDMLYVPPVKAKAHSADISPILGVAIGITSFAISIVAFVLMLTK